MQMKYRCDSFIENSKGEMTEEIISLIGFPSINGRQAENRDCLKYFLDLAKSMGFKTMTTQAWDVGIVEMGAEPDLADKLGEAEAADPAAQETVGILVHLDVVDVGDLEKWSEDPFKGYVKDGYIYGRGAEDDKGAAIMSLYAMKAVKEAGEALSLPLNKKVQLIVGTGEEGVWTDMAHYLQEFTPPDYGFSPDGSFPVYNGENGYVDVELLFHRDGKKGIKNLESGGSRNSIPSKAELEWENGEVVTAHGIAAHSSIPEEGDNAIIRLSEILETMESSEIPESFESTSLDFARFANEILAGEGYGAKLGISGTAVPTVLRLLPHEQGVAMNINIRQSYGVEKKDIIAAFEAFSEKYAYSFEILDYMDAAYVDEDLPFIKIMSSIHEEYGVAGGIKQAPGTTYAKAINNFVSWGPLFEDEDTTAHMEDERFSVDSMILATKLYAGFLRMLLFT